MKNMDEVKRKKPFTKFIFYQVIVRLIEAGIDEEAAINQVIDSYAYSTPVKEGLKQRIRQELELPLRGNYSPAQSL